MQATASALRLPMPEPLEVLGVGTHLTRARWRNLLITRWYGDATLPDLDLVFDDVRRIAKERGGVVVANLLDSGCKPPSAEGRELVSRQQVEAGSSLVAIGTLVDGQGFWASVVLNALLSIQTLKPQRPRNEKVFRSRHDACAWLSGFVSDDPSIAELEGALNHCRQLKTDPRVSGSPPRSTTR